MDDDVVCQVERTWDPVLIYDNGRVKVSPDRVPPNTNTDLCDGVRSVRVCASDPQQAEFLFEYHRIRSTGYAGMKERTKENLQFTVYQPNAAVEAWCQEVGGRNVKIERDLRSELQRETELRQAVQREHDVLKAQLAAVQAQLAAVQAPLAAVAPRLNELFEALQHEKELREADARRMNEMIQALQRENELRKVEVAALQRENDVLKAAAAGPKQAGSTPAALPIDVNSASEG
jgi:hypothetical protein